MDVMYTNNEGDAIPVIKTRKFYKNVTLCMAVFVMLILIGSVSLAASGQTAKDTKAISLIIDQQLVKMKSPPILVKERLMLPAKDTFNAIGAKFSWVDKKLVVTYKDVKIAATLNSTKVIKGSQSYNLPNPPVILEGKLYIPAQLLALLLDRDVTFDSKNRKVSFGYNAVQLAKFEVLMYEAARAGDALTIKTMIDRGVNVNVILEDRYGANSALDYAILNNHTEAAQVLLEHGGIYAPGRASSVIMARNGKLMELLLTHGLDPNLNLYQGTSILAYASSRIYSIAPDGTETILTPSIQIVNLLLEYGADPSQDDSLLAAFQASSYVIVQALLQHGADPYHVNSSGSTAYEFAKSYGNLKWLDLQSNKNIPILSILNMDGTPLLQGTFSLKPKPGFLGYSIHWGGEEVYIDVPDGDYQAAGVMQRGSSYVFSDSKVIRIEKGKVNPDFIQLPRINVKGTLKGLDKDQQNGFLALNDIRGNHLIFIEIVNGKFHLSLPAGTYQFGEYVLSDKKVSLTGTTQLTILDGDKLQQITLSYP